MIIPQIKRYIREFPDLPVGEKSGTCKKHRQTNLLFYFFFGSAAPQEDAGAFFSGSAAPQVLAGAGSAAPQGEAEVDLGSAAPQVVDGAFFSLLESICSNFIKYLH